MDANTQGVALEPCPFCNRPAKVYHAFPEFDEGWHVDCDHDDDCILRQAHGMFACEATAEKSAAAWNRRAYLSAAQEGREAVAWRVKDFADGWILYHTEAAARSYAKGVGDAFIQPLYTHPAPAQPAAQVVDIDALAQEIRRVDGSNTLGAGALAEALAPCLSALAAVPEGYVLAPIEPTETMISEGDRVMYGRYGCSFEVAPIYEAMLTAAKAGEDGR